VACSCIIEVGARYVEGPDGGYQTH